MVHNVNDIKKSRFRKIFQQIMLSIVASFIVLVILSMTGVIQPQMVVSGDVIARQPGASRPEAISQSVNGIKITASSLRRSGDMILVDVCYPLPDKKDWQLREVSLEYGDRIVHEYGTTWIEGSEYPATTTTLGQRCVKLSFMAEQVRGSSGWYLVTIGVLYAEPHEGEFCTTFLEEVQQALDQRETGIQVKCAEPPVGGIEIANIPDGMTMEEANEFLQSKDFRYSFRAIQGPWIFEFFLDD